MNLTKELNMTKQTLKRYQTLLNEKVITKSQTNAITKMMRELDRQQYLSYHYDDKAVDQDKKQIVDQLKDRVIYDHYELTTEQNKFGIKWLRSYVYKKNGEPRKQKGNDFNENHRTVIDNFSHFLLVGFEDIAQGNNFGHYRPIYRCVAKGGSYFDYVPNVPFNGYPVYFVSRTNILKEMNKGA